MLFTPSMSGMYSDAYTTALTCSSYRQVPTFGCGTIRRFNDEVSAMKKLAARNWEDLIQVKHQ